MTARLKPDDWVTGGVIIVGLAAALWDWIVPDAWIGAKLPNLTIICLSSVILALWRINHRVSRIFSQSLSERLSFMLKGGTSSYHQLVDSHTNGIAQNLMGHIEHKTVTLYNVAGFPQLYIKAMETLPGESFSATAFADRLYFWSNENVNEAMRRFIKKRGKLRRIFFLDFSRPVPRDQIEVLMQQHEMGVQVFTADLAQIDVGDQTPFLFNARKTIGWTVERHNQKTPITKITVTANSANLTDMAHRFDRILHADGTRRFHPDRLISGDLQ